MKSREGKSLRRIEKKREEKTREEKIRKERSQEREDMQEKRREEKKEKRSEAKGREEKRIKNKDQPSKRLRRKTMQVGEKGSKVARHCVYDGINLEKSGENNRWKTTRIYLSWHIYYGMCRGVDGTLWVMGPLIL